MWYIRGRRDKHIEFWWGKLRERVCLKDLDVDERIILNYILI